MLTTLEYEWQFYVTRRYGAFYQISDDRNNELVFTIKDARERWLVYDGCWNPVKDRSLLDQAVNFALTTAISVRGL